MNPLLDAALGYAARGIPVYPVHWPRPTPGGDALGCSCHRGAACDRPAKHPLVRHGVNDATTDPGQLQGWWRRWPTANLGLATGVVFDALDVDDPAGLAALRQLARTAELQFLGPVVATGGGGWHIWFRPTGLGNRPPRGLAEVDWRGKGGSVLAPPSRHNSGQPYRWLRGLDQAPLPMVPAALRALLAPDRPTTTGPADPTRAAALGHRYGRQVLAGELAALGRATPGYRNRTLNACAFKVYRYVASGLLDDHEVTVAFTTVALAIGLDRAEIGRTLASARTAGLANPAPSRPDPATAARRTGHDRPLDLPDKRRRRPVARRGRVHPVLRRPASAGPGQPRATRPGLAVAGGHRRHHRGRAADRAGRQTRRRQGRLPMDASRVVLGRVGRLQHRPRPQRPVAQLVFAMAPVALVLTTHLLMQQVSWRRPTSNRPAVHKAGPNPHTRIRRPSGPYVSRHLRIKVHR
jgi:bifunctional DNA primase/polymerase-like protein